MVADSTPKFWQEAMSKGVALFSGRDVIFGNQ